MALDSKLLHPRHWPVWLGIGLMRLTVPLPYRFQLSLGGALGRLFCRLSPKRRRIAEVNLQICFPDRDEAWRQQILEKHFESAGRALLEMPLSWWGSEKQLWLLRHIRGQEHLREALDRGKGVLLLSAHFTSVEMGGRLLLLDTPIHVMYRAHGNPVIEHIMGGARDRISEKAIPRDDVRYLIRALRKGKAVWYAPDQNSQRKAGVFVNFFGYPASTSAATARLSAMTGAAVVPFKAVRRGDGKGFDLSIEPALESYPSGDLEADTQRINDIIERWVRENPEQYLWIHRRFRTRPVSGEPSPYA